MADVGKPATPARRRRQTTRIQHGSVVQRALQSGLGLAERVLGPTLGPFGTPVAVARVGRPGSAPDLLDDGATIARRLLAIPDPLENAGLMLARHAAWRQHGSYGDGTATTVVLAASAHRELLRRAPLASSVVGLRAEFERAVEQAAALIEGMGRPARDAELTQLARAAVGDEGLADVACDVILRAGPEAVLLTRDAPHDGVQVQYVDGALWEADLASTVTLGAISAEQSLADVRVLVWDGPIDTPRDVARVLETLVMTGVSSALFVARSFAAPVLGLLAVNRDAIRVAPVLAPMAGQNQAWALEDIAALAGTRVQGPERGDRLRGLDAGALGRVRRVRVGSRHLNLSAEGAQDPGIRARREAIARQIELEEDRNARRALQERLGRLSGGMTVIWVGGRTDPERALRRATLERGLRHVSAVVRQGTVPGGGASFLGAARLLDEGQGGDGALAAAALREALGRPAGWIVGNARRSGHGPMRVTLNGAPERGLDVRTGRYVDLRAAGIVDPTLTVIGALRAGGSIASTGLSLGYAVVRDGGAPVSWRP